MPNLMKALEGLLIAIVNEISSLEINYTLKTLNIGKWFLIPARGVKTVFIIAKLFHSILLWLIFNIRAQEVIRGRVHWIETNLAMRSKSQDSFFDNEKSWTWSCDQLKPITGNWSRDTVMWHWPANTLFFTAVNWS